MRCDGWGREENSGKSVTYSLHEHIRDCSGDQTHDEDGRERRRRIADTVILHAWDTEEILNKGHIRQGGEGVHHLEEEHLRDQVVLVLGVCAVILVVVQIERYRAVHIVEHLGYISVI
jgi:hypothetical protein